QPTGRSLKDIEPRTPIQSLSGNPDYLYVISQPGSYYLAGDIAVPPNKRAILVAAQSGSVSIDMEGFTIRGVSTGNSGIVVAVPGTDYPEISDATLADLDGDGIDGGGARVLDCFDLHIDHCGRGIVARNSAVIEACHVERCATDGLAWIKPSTTDTTTFLVDE